MHESTCLVWVRYGSRGGRQLAHLHKVLEGGICIASKWLDNGRRWTGRVVFSVTDIREYEIDLADLVVQRAIRAATGSRPFCRHNHHLTPVVRSGSCDSSRQAVTA